MSMGVREAPGIETDRLLLRGHRLEDYEDCAALWADPEVTRFIGGTPLSGEEVWARLLRYAGHWPLMGYGYWALREKASGRFVGDVGFANLKRAIEPSLGDAPEIGWVLAPWASGRGMATEAVAAVVAWGDAQPGFDQTCCIIRNGHERSIRVATKVGYSWARPAIYRGDPITIYTRRRLG